MTWTNLFICLKVYSHFAIFIAGFLLWSFFVANLFRVKDPKFKEVK